MAGKAERIRAVRQLARLSQEKFAESLGTSRGAVGNWELGKGIKHENLAQISEKFAVSLDWLSSGAGNAPKLDPSLSQRGKGTVNHSTRDSVTVPSHPLHPIPSEQLMGKTDLPVYSIVQGGRGALVLSSEPFTSIARPQNLLGIKDAYGVLVKGNSMAREFNEGDIAYVDPHKPPREGDPCVFQSHGDDGTVEAVLKYLARSPDASNTVWYVEQTNPSKKFTLKKAEWQICHVATGKQSGR